MPTRCLAAITARPLIYAYIEACRGAHCSPRVFATDIYRATIAGRAKARALFISTSAPWRLYALYQCRL